MKDRIYQHHINKDFWNIVYAVYLDTGFTEAHTGYLEAFFINEAKAMQGCTNLQEPKKKFLTRSLKAELSVYTSTIKLILSILGLKIFEKEPALPNKIAAKANILQNTTINSISQNNLPQNILFCKDKAGNHGKAILKSYNNNFATVLLLKGAICIKEVAKTFQSHITKQNLISTEKLVLQNGRYILQQDIEVSPSFAAGLILGISADGYIHWKTEDGQTLNQLLDRQPRKKSAKN